MPERGLLGSEREKMGNSKGQGQHEGPGRRNSQGQWTECCQDPCQAKRANVSPWDVGDTHPG